MNLVGQKSNIVKFGGNRKNTCVSIGIQTLESLNDLKIKYLYITCLWNKFKLQYCIAILQ